MKPSSLLLLALAAAIPGPALTQGLEVFEIGTFVDPAALTITGEDGGQQELSFLAVYWRFGAADNYQYRSRFVRSEVPFSDMTATFVHRRTQLTARWIELGGMPGGTGQRIEARLGRYLAASGTREEGGSEEESKGDAALGRIEGSIARQNGTGIWDGVTLGARAELSALASRDVVGGISYSYFRPDGAVVPRRSQGPSPATHFLSADFRTDIWNPGRAYSLDLGGGVGASHDVAGTRWGTLRGELRLKWRPQRDRVRLYAVYAPAYQLQRTAAQRRYNHELSAFVQVRVLTRVLTRLGPAKG